MTRHTFFSRLIAAALYTAVLAGTWDAWWHGAMGRDSFWEAPHLLLYSAIFVAIASGVYAWRKLGEKVWRNLAMILLLIPISAPFDDLWHRAYGVEDISSVLAIWSPPHLVLIFAMLASLILLLPTLRTDKDLVAKRFFGAMTFAAMLSLVLLLLAPFIPIGPWHLLGFWGAGLCTAALVAIILLAQKWIPGLGSATLLMLFYIAIQSLTFSEVLAPGVIVAEHDHPPAWLTTFSLLIPAVIVDIFSKWSVWMRAGLLGLLSSGLFYGLASFFLEPEFQYPLQDGIIAIVASLVMSLIVGGVIMLFYKKN